MDVLKKVLVLVLKTPDLEAYFPKTSRDFLKSPEPKPSTLVKSYARLGSLLQQLSAVSDVTAICKALVAVCNFYSK